MGRDLFGRDPFIDELRDAVRGDLGLDLGEVCLKGPARKLSRTEFLQPAMCAVSLTLWRRLDEAGVVPCAVAGHSMGELSALAASGVLAPADVMRLAVVRGRAMAAAAQHRKGSMAAVSALEAWRVVEEVESWQGGILDVGAVGAASQTTITGDEDQVDGFCSEISKKYPGARCKKLSVSGGWHSRHMLAAGEALEEAVAGVDAAPAAKVPFVAGRDGRASRDSAAILEAFCAQLTSPVRWDRVMSTLLGELSATVFVEIGPGRVLRGLVRLATEGGGLDVEVHSVSDRRSLERTVKALEGAG